MKVQRNNGGKIMRLRVLLQIPVKTGTKTVTGKRKSDNFGAYTSTHKN